MTSKDSMLGKKIDEYQLDSLLGHGGMARVYRGIDTSLQRYVAIKVIDAQFRADSEYARRFEKEAQAIAQLDHPHVVSLYRYGNVDDVLYMAMQYIEGSDLRRMMDAFQADGSFMEADEALRIIREIGRGLDYIHQRGIIHRDLKPANIMLTQDGTAIITDFGLALVVDVGTRGEIFGTPHYISPEQAVSSAKVVPQSDIYALGVMAYEIFTNKLPFTTGEALDIAMAHVSEDPPPPRSFRPELSEAIESVLLKSLAKDAHERHQSGAELADELEAAIQKSHARTQKTTMPRHSIIERVQLDMQEHPLPPIPAAAAQPKRGKKQKKQRSSVGQGKNIEQPEKTMKHVPQTTQKAAPNPAQKTRMAQPTGKKGMGAIAPYLMVGAIVLLSLIIGFLVFFNGSGEDDPILQTATKIAAENAQIATESALVIEETNIAQAATNNLVATENAGTETQVALSQVQPTLTHTALPTNVPASTTTVPTATHTVTPIPTATQAPSLTPIPTATQAPSLTPIPPLPTESVAQSQPAIITLNIYTNGNKAMRIINTSSIPLPLSLLKIVHKDDAKKLLDDNPGNDPDDPRQITGEVWSPELLEGGVCLDAYKNARREAPEDTPPCSSLFFYLAEDKEHEIWDKGFTVFYNNSPIQECKDKEDMCEVNIPVTIDG